MHRKPGLENILLIHGFAASSHLWTSLEKPLSKDFGTLSVDLLGFGQSSKIIKVERLLDLHVESILALLDSLNISNCHVVGRTRLQTSLVL